MKRFFSSLLLTAFLAVSGSSWALSDVDGVYQIGSADDLVAFAALGDVATAKALVTADIDMAGKGWTGITGYVGTFDGGNFIISNLGAPLFATTGDGVILKNLTLEGAITTDETAAIGAFVATHNGGIFTAENLTNKTSVTAAEATNVGGIVGYFAPTAAGCTFTDCQNTAAVSGKSAVGGLVGYYYYNNSSNATFFTDCSNTANITSSGNAVGGIVGSIIGRFESSGGFNSGNVTSTDGNYAGGCFGSSTQYLKSVNKFKNSGNITAKNSAGGIIGYFYNTSKTLYLYIHTCSNSGDVTATTYAGGMIGRTRASSNYLYYTNDINTGTITGVPAAGIAAESRRGDFVRCCNVGTIITNASGRALTCGGTGATLKNCWNNGEIVLSEGELSGETLVQSSGTVTITSSYDLANAAMSPTHGTPAGYEDAWMTNGHFCYFLNEEIGGDILYYQTLGEDAYPVFDDTHKTVYAIAPYKCDGVTPKGAISYSNVNSAVVDAHTFATGFCTECGAADLDYMAPNGDGFYEISNVQQLQWFAALVSINKEAAAKGKLTADIDMDGKGWTGITGFNGTFDGGNFTISNLGAPLFASTVSGVTINNLTLEGALTVASGDNVGAFIASHDGAKINLANCVNKTNITATESEYVGGFIGKANISSNNSNNALENCVNQGAVSGKNYTAGLIGAQVWSNGGTECLHIRNCANTAIVSGDSFVGGLVGSNSCRIYYDDSYNEGKISATGASVGGLLGRGNRGWQYFTRCHNSGAVSGASQVAGLFGDYYRGSLSYTTFVECYNEGDVYGTGDNVGGIMGRAYVDNSSPFEYTRCYNVGKVYGPKAHIPAAIAHWSNAAVTITDCWTVGEIISVDDDFDASDVNTLIKASNSQNVTNSYDLANAAMSPTYGIPAGYEDAWLANGTFTYYINSKAGKIAYRQTLGTDAHPVFDATHGIVNKISAAGYATQYIADTDVTIPAGVKAYAGKLNGEWLTLTEVTEKIPAATAVVLEGAEGYYSFMPTTGAAAVAENDLVGTATALEADGSQYVLAKKDDVVGFYQATEGTIAAGKAYLTGISAGVKAVTFGTATGIASPLGETEEGTIIYDLSGRRVEKATKGLYIVNGKKVLK